MKIQILQEYMLKHVTFLDYIWKSSLARHTYLLRNPSCKVSVLNEKRLSHYPFSYYTYENVNAFISGETLQT